MQYHVVLCTELGNRSGVLQLERKQDNLTGQLSILGTQTAVVGQVKPDGSCELRGHLITPVNDCPFCADGSYGEEQGLCLTVRAGDRIYKLYGTPDYQKQSAQSEQRRKGEL